MLFYVLVGSAAAFLIMKTKKSMESVAIPSADEYYVDGTDGAISQTKLNLAFNSYRGVGAFNKGTWQQSAPDYITGTPSERLEKLQSLYANVIEAGAKKGMATVANTPNVVVTPLPMNRTNEKLDPAVYGAIRQPKRQYFGTTTPSNYLDPTQMGTKADPPHDWGYKN